MKWLKRLGMVIGTLVVIGGFWVAYYDARDWAAYYWNAKGTLAHAPVTDEVSKGGVTFNDIQIGNDRGVRVNGRLSMPEEGHGPWPAAILVAGVETGCKVLDLIPPQKNMVLLALDYPGSMELDFSGLVPAVESALRFRRGCMQMVEAVLIGHDVLQMQRLVRKDRVAVVGVSVGAAIAAAAGAADERFERVVLVQGAARVHQLAAANAARLHLPLEPDMVSMVAEWLFVPLEPLQFVGRIAPRPLTMLNSKQDQFMPTVLVDELFGQAGEPKKMIWMAGGDALPDEKTLITELTQRVLTELASIPLPGQKAGAGTDAMGR